MKLRPVEIPKPLQHPDGFLLYECAQGTPEWLAMRAGVITASEFHTARARMKAARDGKQKGDPTDACLDYAFQKAIERISRVPLDENHQTWQMKRGHLLEPEARACHEDLLAQRNLPLTEMMVLPAGFMTTPDGFFGCSVDGLIGQHGGSEYKCLVAAKKLRKVILLRDISDYMDQIQGCMWISGRKWWHFGLYCPALKPVGLEFQMVEVERDDDYIEAMEQELMGFKIIVDEYEERLRDLGAHVVDSLVEEARARLAEPAGDVEPSEVEDAF